MKVMGGGALGPLVAVSNSADLETQRCIAYALCNLAADPRRRIDVVRYVSFGFFIVLVFICACFGFDCYTFISD